MKLDDALAEREATRSKLLELRSQLAQREKARAQLVTEIGAMTIEAKREQTKLVELTSQAAKLLHADLAGLTGSNGSNGSNGKDDGTEAQATS